jgi:DNA-binding response OmpR family regulator
MSAETDEGLRIDALDAGASSFLTKPLDVARLFRTLESLLRAHEDSRGGKAF